MKNNIITLKKPGGPEVLEYKEEEISGPGPNEVLVKHTAIGVNFVDTYHRSGLYPLPLPGSLGVEASGVVEKLGKEIKDFKIGDRVAYGTTPPGSYTEYRNVAENFLVKIPEFITDGQAASIMVKGLTAYYLLYRTTRLNKGDFVLVHAAAGGVGQILTEWGKNLGLRIIATVGNAGKAKIASAKGAEFVIDYKKEDFAKKTLELTKGEGVKVSFDSVGKDTFQGSLEALGRFGMLVSFGNASGPLPPFDSMVLAKKSLFFTRPSLFTYMATREELEEGAKEMFQAIKDGEIKIPEPKVYELKDAALAHRDLEARKTTGAAVLVPVKS